MSNHSLHTILIILTAIAGAGIAYLIFNTQLTSENTSYSESNISEFLSPDTLASRIDTTPTKKYVITNQKLKEDLKLEESSATKYFLNFHPKLLMWQFLFITLIAISFGFTIPLIHEIRKLYIEFRFSMAELIICLIPVLLVMTVSVIAGTGETQTIDQTPGYLSPTNILEDSAIVFENAEDTLRWLKILVLASPFFAIFGLMLIIFSLNKLQKKTNIRHTVNRFKLLSHALNFMLFTVAIIITGSVITSALLRDLIYEYYPKHLTFIYPVEFVYIYGLIFTFILAVFYVPLYFQLNRIGKSLATEYFDLINNTPLSKQENITQAETEEMKNILFLKSSSLDTIKIITSILAPALTGFVSSFLGF